MKTRSKKSYPFFDVNLLPFYERTTIDLRDFKKILEISNNSDLDSIIVHQWKNYGDEIKVETYGDKRKAGELGETIKDSDGNDIIERGQLEFGEKNGFTDNDFYIEFR